MSADVKSIIDMKGLSREVWVRNKYLNSKGINNIVKKRL